PVPAQLTTKERGEALDLQNKIRQTVIQIAAGLGFLFSVFMAVNAQDSSNRDLKAKYDRESAELFIKATESKSPEALYALAYIARRDKENYHDIVYRVVASLIASAAPTACADKASEPRTAAATKVQVAMQLLHERNVGNDISGGRYNIEHSCLNGVNLQVERAIWGRYRGLVGVRASGSSLRHVDFTRTEVQGDEFMGINAGDWRNPGWEQEEHRHHLHDLDQNGQPKWSDKRRKYVAHFVDANLTGATFRGAGLEGADFSGAVLKEVEFDGANISRTSFRGAQDLTAKQLRKACVGRTDDPDPVHQPIIDDPTLKQELDKQGGVPWC